MTWELEERETSIRYLIHDHDKNVAESFDKVFRSEGIEIIHTPLQAPNANAIAERWVHSVREECLDKMLILNERHHSPGADRVPGLLQRASSHQGLDQDSPLGLESVSTERPIRYRNVLGDIVRDYYREAA